MMNPLVYVVAAVVVAVLLWFVTRAGPRVEDPSTNDGSLAQSTEQGGVRRRRNIRSGIQRHAQDIGTQDQSEDFEDDSKINRESKVGAKKFKKLQQKEEKRRIREQEIREREEKKKELEAQEEQKKLEEELRLKEEERIAEVKRKEQEEKERQEHEEYLKLKAMFSVEEEGHQELNSEEQGQNMLMEFVEYVKTNKVVLLEDLASHFGLRTQDAIDRVQNMLKDEILSGVIDDRGKFIYISSEELAAVAKFVKQRGRIPISDLAQASNSLINLISESATAKS